MTSLTKEVKKVIRKKYSYAIVDAMNMSYKYYYGLSQLKSKEGIKTGLYHGFLSLLLRLKKDYAETIIIAWEGNELVRKKAYNLYKANRTEKPDDLKKSIEQLKDLISLLGIEQKFVPGYEADDVAAYYCEKYKIQKILLVTEDSDWLQILNINCKIFKKNKVLSYNYFKDLYGYPPERILLYKMIRGDKKDNIFGISRFPEELAKNIVENCKNLSEALKYKPLNMRYKKWIISLEKNKPLLTNNYELLKLKSDVIVEDLPCQKKKNISKLKEQLINLQLYKVFSLVKNL